MIIGLTSENNLKLNAVITAYSFINEPFKVVGYSADSGVGEQPVNEQTLLGARNRIADVKSRVEGLDRIISIENGIFQENGEWLDKAVVVIYDLNHNKEFIDYSDSVIFPGVYVEKARQIGFDEITVGKVMADDGFVANAKDPHLSISGISRQVYLEKTVKDLVELVENGRS